MKYSIMSSPRKLYFYLLSFALVLHSCTQEDDSLAITNDLRVLQVNIGDKLVEDGIAELSVLTQVELVFSHDLDAATFEGALTVSPSVAYTVAYDETGSIVTLSPDTRLEYETNYTISLAAGSYGSGGEQSTEEFSFSMTTKAFAPPMITLSSDVATIFEGEVATVTVTLDNEIFDAVSFDLVFGGSATSDGVDFTSSTNSISIPAGSTEAAFTIEGVSGDEIEGEESIVISLANVVNGSNTPPVELTILLGDKAPAMELKGVMELDNYIDGSNGRVRAIHLNVLKDIPDLSIFHIQIASNGAAPDPLDIDFVFPANAATAGDQLFVVRDADAALAATYFGSDYAAFTEFQTAGMTHNGDDAILLYENGAAIESFGEPGVDGTDQYWEHTDSWAYKLGEEWYYAGVDCVENAVGEATDATSTCRYPAFSPGLEFRGILSLQPSAGRIRAYHLIALKDIADLSIFGAGIASNGQATSDGVEITFPSQSVSAGEHILLVRDADIDRAADYFEGCYNNFDHVIPDDGVSSNGDDTVELFKNGILIETYGELGVDGTGQFWEYADSWAYKVSGSWTYGGASCNAGADTSASSSCAYTFCN
jgi:hypothetical protein